MKKKRIKLDDTYSDYADKFDPLHWSEGNPLERTAKFLYTNQYNSTYHVFLEHYGRDYVIDKARTTLKFFHNFILEDKKMMSALSKVLSNEFDIDKKAARIVIKKMLRKIGSQLDEQAKE